MGGDLRIKSVELAIKSVLGVLVIVLVLGENIDRLEHPLERSRIEGEDGFAFIIHGETVVILSTRVSEIAKRIDHIVVRHSEESKCGG